MDLAPLRSPTAIPDLIAYWARTTPDAPAILSPGRAPLSFAALFDRIGIVKRTLQEMGIQPHDRVAIVLPNGPEMAVSFLGVAAAAAAAPLNPAYRASELSVYFDDLQPRAVIVQQGVASPATAEAAARHIPVLQLTPDLDAGAGTFAFPLLTERAGAARGVAGAVDVALVLHTSGTTSKPRMVPLTHTHLVISAHAIAQSLALTTADRCLNVMPLFHVHGLIGALLSSLAAGSSVVCTSGFLATHFFDWVTECRPTWYTAVPTIHQAVVAQAGQQAVPQHSLRFVRSSSSALAPALMQRLEATFSVPALEAYGMTEAAHQIAINPLPPRQRKPGSVGLSTGPDVAIIDEGGNPLPHGSTGEIGLRGDTIMSGYVGDAAVNERAFVNGWFRTGDVGSLDRDGYLFITARIKEIINRGGEKISPREVEEVLLEHPSVAEAVAFAIPHASLGEDVAAAVVPKPGVEVDEASLRRFAAEHLASFKVPRVVRVVPEIPKGATGKIQRIGMSDRLAMTGGAAPLGGRVAFRPPQTRLEQQLAAIWKEMLGIETVGVDDDFFTIGGDSILATLLAVRVSSALNAQVALVEFETSPTIASMAAAIEARPIGSTARDDRGVLVAIQPNGTKRPFFCAPPMDGSLLGFSRLSRHLDRDQPVWGFAPPQLGPGQWSYSIEGVAARYVQAMQAQQPEGQYVILGDCFGGFVAYEMACQLRRRGSDVALLVIVDAFFRSGWRRQSSQVTFITEQVRHGLRRTRAHLSILHRLAGGERLSYLRARFTDFGRSLQHRVLQTVYDASVTAGVSVPAAARALRYANARAERCYTPERYAGRIAVVSTTDPSAGIYPGRLSGWEGMLEGPVHAIELPGDHQSRFLDSGAAALAERLTLVLEQARASQSPSADRADLAASIWSSAS